MARRKTITPEMRRHCDYLRRKALATSRIYGSRLKRFRNANIRKLLNFCADTAEPEQWAGIIDMSFTEPYMRDIIQGVFMSAGMDQARSTVRDLNKAKAAESDELESLWAVEIGSYAKEHAGEQVVTVAGGVKKTLRKILERRLLEDYSGVEKVVQAVMRDYREQDEWQVRRIIQTETMFALGKAGQVASDSLGVRYTKQWATSGLINTRDSHLAVDGVVVGQDEFFEVGGALLMYPHDSRPMVPAGEVVNCACSCIRMPD